MNLVAKLSIFSLLSLSVVAGCAVNADSDGEDNSEQGVSEAISAGTSLTPGSFRLYNDAGHVPSPTCDIYTQLDLTKTSGARATLSEHVEGLCKIAIAPNKRSFNLHQVGTSCGSKIYEGQRNVQGGGKNKIKITDHRSRLCMDMPAGQVIVEETVPGFPGAITTTLYSMSPSAPSTSITVEGNLFTSFGIGGENTGRSIEVGSDVFELVLDSGEASRFVDGRFARVKGTKTFLSGVETHNRPAINVDNILVCPASGTTLNCMPPVQGGALSLCSGENRGWIEAKCSGVSYVD